MKFNVPGKLVVPRINRNNEVENTGYPIQLTTSDVPNVSLLVMDLVEVSILSINTVVP